MKDGKNHLSQTLRTSVKPVIAGLFPELLANGGLQLAGRLTAAALSAIAAEQGWPYRFFSLNDAPQEHEACLGHLRFQFRGFGRDKVRFSFAAWQIARAHPQYVFAAHPNLGPVAVAMQFASKSSQFIIGTHGIEVWQPLPRLRRRALRNAEIVLAPSSDTVRKLSEVQLTPESKIRKLPWPLDPDFLVLADSAKPLPLPAQFPSGQVILTVGRWAASERYKGADLLIQAVPGLATEFPDLHLVLAGTGDDLERLKDLARTAGIANRAHFPGNISREELAGCYARAEIFALPSSGEGFGLVFLEAMAMEKPVIGAAAGGIPDIVESGATGLLVEPNNPASLAATLRTLLSDAGMRKKMGQQAGVEVRNRYCFSRFQDELREILLVRCQN